MLRPIIELGQPGTEVRTHLPNDLLHPVQVCRGPHWVPVLGDENQVGVQDEDTVPACAYVAVLGHKTKYAACVQLRYNYRLDPARRHQRARCQ